MGPSLPLRLLVVGESTVAGVGAPTHTEALSGQLAAALAAGLGRAVRWRDAGEIGATASAVWRRLLLALPVKPAESGASSPWRERHPAAARPCSLAGRPYCADWRVARTGGPAPIFLAAVPPLGRFPALPQPLRAVLGLRAHLLDLAAADLAPRLEAVTHLPLTLAVTPHQFCADGFHPGLEGYRQWGALLEAGMVERLRKQRSVC